MNKWIQIWYSWGDQESPVEVPDDKDPWQYMMELAIKEARIDLIEKEPELAAVLQIDPNMEAVTLYYSDGYRCFYRLTDEEEWDPDEDEEEWDPDEDEEEWDPDEEE